MVSLISTNFVQYLEYGGHPKKSKPMRQDHCCGFCTFLFPGGGAGPISTAEEALSCAWAPGLGRGAELRVGYLAVALTIGSGLLSNRLNGVSGKGEA